MKYVIVDNIMKEGKGYRKRDKVESWIHFLCTGLYVEIYVYWVVMDLWWWIGDYLIHRLSTNGF
jgi:hypothetical protein